MKKILWIPLALGLVGLAWQGPRLLRARVPPAQVQMPLSACDLNLGPCRVALPTGGEFILEIAPRPIPTLSPLKICLRVSGASVDQAMLDLSGVEMEMGFNRITQKPVGEGVFEGQGSLPVCVQGRMLWQAQLVLGQQGELAIPFRLASGE